MTTIIPLKERGGHASPQRNVLDFVVSLEDNTRFAAEIVKDRTGLNTPVSASFHCPKVQQKCNARQNPIFCETKINFFPECGPSRASKSEPTKDFFVQPEELPFSSPATGFDCATINNKTTAKEKVQRQIDILS